MPEPAPTETAASNGRPPLAGRYRLRTPIGAGAAARVYLADDLVLDRTVAVKLLDAAAAGSADPAGRDRFAREARSLATFRDPHVVTLLDAGEADGELYVVLEFVDGGSLAELIARSAPLPIDDVMQILDDVLAGLATVHAGGLVHRDVKPGNVLLTSDGRAKLADFGIARWLDDIEMSLTSPGTVIGTERYMAPERLAGGPVTVASDLYSVAVVAFEMLAGQEAPGARSEGRRAIASDLLRLRPDAPIPLVVAIQRALAAHPGDRFATAHEMSTALGSTAEPTLQWVPPAEAMPQPAPAPPAPAPVPPSRPARRWPLVAAIAALVLAGVIAAAATITGNDPAAGPTSPATAPTTVATPAPSTSTPTTLPTTVPLVTTPPPATAPTIAVGADDLAAFITALRAGGDRGGRAAKQLGDRLEKLAEDARQLTGDGGGHALDKWQRDAQRLGDDLSKWSQKGQLDPDVAAQAQTRIDELASSISG